MSLAEYSNELLSQAGRLLAGHPDLRHEWQPNGDLVFPAVSEQGFEVTLQPDGHGVIVFTGVGFHEHVVGDPRDAVQQALGLARDLLSPDMRIREQQAGGRGYRWTLDRRDASGWTRESTTGSLFWNYFGRRSERVYQNAQLTGRLVDAGRVGTSHEPK